MRSIGHLADAEAANHFRDFLLVQGVESQVEADPPAGWSVWVLADEDLARATAWLTEYRANPRAPQFQGARREADARRAQKAAEQSAYEKRQASRRQLFRPLRNCPLGPLTAGLMCLCVATFIKSDFGKDLPAVGGLFMSVTDRTMGFAEHLAAGLPEVRHGEIWRLFTPVIMHANFIHLLFNMLWFRDLGSLIEDRQSTGYLAGLVLVFALVSNLTQYLFVGPIFLGLSGVVYGLVGYVWLRGKLDPGSGLFLLPINFAMQIIWFCIGFLGASNMANGAHAGGLVAGLIWGWLSSLPHRRPRTK